MEQAFLTATIWLILAVTATILANHLKVSMALTEICVGVIAGVIAERYIGPDSLGANLEWLRFPGGPRKLKASRSRRMKGRASPMNNGLSR